MKKEREKGKKEESLFASAKGLLGMFNIQICIGNFPRKEQREKKWHSSVQ